MANKNNISTALKRNLQNGKEYDKLIPTVKCERTNLGSGDTFHTVDAMKDWIEKYSFQTQKLAPVLKGKSLEETVNNIYQFLYTHIQYEADGLLQQLRSPACTWKQRQDGVDCKSYSVFASSILYNLGIKHMIRQVRQPGFHEDQFTHVYIVVPKNQNGNSSNSATFVLDATKHQNIEGRYIEKVDLTMNNMKHIGLNAPNDKRTLQIVDNFNAFSKMLLNNGVPLESVNAVRTRISEFTSAGKDPNIEIVPVGIKIEGVVFPLEFKKHVPFLVIHKAFNGKKGLGFSAAFNGTKGLGFSFSDAFTQIKGDITNVSGSGGSGTTTEAGIVDGAMTLASGAIPFGGIIKGILDEMEIGANISNVLKYGLSSWGASKTPEELKKRFAETILPWLQDMLAKTTIDNISSQITAIDVNLRGNSQFFKKLKENHSRAKSTRLANEYGEQECAKLLEEVLTGFNKQLATAGVTVQRRTVGAKSSALSKYPITSVDGDNIKNDRYWDEIDYYVYEVDRSTLKNWNTQQLQQNPQQNTGGSNPTGSTGGSTGNYNPTGEYQNIQNPEGGEKSNTGLIIGGVAMAALPLLFFMKKDKKK